MRLNRQQRIILRLLREAGKTGINSFVYRKSFVQLPVRISELKDFGYSIISQRNPDRSVNYILESETKPKTTWVYKGNTAYQVVREAESYPTQLLEVKKSSLPNKKSSQGYLTTLTHSDAS